MERTQDSYRQRPTQPPSVLGFQSRKTSKTLPHMSCTNIATPSGGIYSMYARRVSGRERVVHSRLDNRPGNNGAQRYFEMYAERVRNRITTAVPQITPQHYTHNLQNCGLHSHVRPNGKTSGCHVSRQSFHGIHTYTDKGIQPPLWGLRSCQGGSSSGEK